MAHGKLRDTLVEAGLDSPEESEAVAVKAW